MQMDKGSVFVIGHIYDADFCCVTLKHGLLLYNIANVTPPVGFFFKMILISCLLFLLAAVKPSLTSLEGKVN